MSTEVEIFIDDLPPVDEPEGIITDLPPEDEPEEIIEEDTQPSVGITPMPHLIERNEMGKNQPIKPPTPEPEDVVDYKGIEYSRNHPVQEELVTGNEDVGPLGKMKKRVAVRLEEKKKAPQAAPQIMDKNEPAAYKINYQEGGDKEYTGKGHRMVLVKEEADGVDEALEDEHYYLPGYQGNKGEDLGDERAKHYEYERAIRKREMEAPAFEKNVQPPAKKRTKPKVEKNKKKAKKKSPKKVQIGEEEYPLKLVKKNDKFLKSYSFPAKNLFFRNY